MFVQFFFEGCSSIASNGATDKQMRGEPTPLYLFRARRRKAKPGTLRRKMPKKEQKTARQFKKEVLSTEPILSQNIVF